MSKFNNAWTKEEVAILVELQAQGLTDKEISAQMKEDGYERTPQNIKDGRRRNKLVREALFGDNEYAERQIANRSATLEQSKSGPVGTVLANRPRTEDEMAELFDIDQDAWYADKIITNQWGHNWQTKIFWRLSDTGVMVSAGWETLLEHLRKGAKAYAAPKRGPDSHRMALLEVVDAHHGALSWSEETGTDWDLNISVKEHVSAHTNLLSRIPRKTDKIVLRIGDDIFHFDKLLDGKAGMTQKGTVQDIDTRWQKLFLRVSGMVTHLIRLTAARIPNVDVIVIPGNHDYQTSFYLGQVLEAAFTGDERVHFDITPRQRKYYRWGNLLLLLTHKYGRLGINSLADKVREEARKDWGETNYVEVHMADEHHEEVLDKTGTGVVIRKLRGLVPNDSWHHDEGFSSHRGAQMFIFGKESGLEENHYYRTTRQAPYLGDRDLGPVLGEK